MSVAAVIRRLQISPPAPHFTTSPIRQGFRHNPFLLLNNNWLQSELDRLAILLPDAVQRTRKLAQEYLHNSN